MAKGRFLFAKIAGRNYLQYQCGKDWSFAKRKSNIRFFGSVNWGADPADKYQNKTFMEFLIKDTPAKIVALLGVSLTSMFLLFAVSYGNASFTQVQTPLPDTFGPSQVMSYLDSASSAYSNFLAVNLFQPVQRDMAFYGDNLAFIGENASPALLKLTGLETLAQVSSPRPQVAGAFTSRPQMQPMSYQSGEGFSVDSLYSILIR